MTFNMRALIGKPITKLLGLAGFALVPENVSFFRSDRYQRIDARRLEHLASLGIPVAGMSVLEVGAGIGDLTHYYLDRGCEVTTTEARAENLAYLQRRYPTCAVRFLDMESPGGFADSLFDVVHCYGLLYHLSAPKQALEFLSRVCRRMLFVETCVSFGDEEEVNLVVERRSNPTQSFSGTGCRPTRRWVFAQLERLFDYVYVPTTQPWHEEFPLDWADPKKHKAPLQRAIFIGSREPIENDNLTGSLIVQQRRHE